MFKQAYSFPSSGLSNVTIASNPRFNASQGKQLPQLVSQNQYTRGKPVHILDQRPAMQCTETVYLQVQDLHPDDPIAQKSISRLQPIVAERQEKMKDEMLGAPLVLLLNAVVQVLTWQRWILLPECVLIAALAPQVCATIVTKPLKSSDIMNSAMCRQAEGTWQHCPRQVWHVLVQL